MDVRVEPIKFAAQVDPKDTDLNEKKKRLKASIEAKRRSNLDNKLRARQNKTIEVSQPIKNSKSQMLREKREKEEEMTRLSITMS